MKCCKLVTFVTLLVLIVIECKRNYRHSQQELKLTKKVVIDQRKCRKNEIPIVIHSAARSTGKYFDRRQTSRNTWVKEARQYQMRPMFFIGLATDDQTQEELQLEAKQYNDMIQFGFIDNYYNLTLKALSILRWIRKNCLTSDYVLKTDDDVLINVPLLDTQFKEKGFEDGLTGKMLTTRSNRFFRSKWYMPENVYQHSYYRFLYGFSYVMSKNSIKRMYRKASNFSDPVLDIDDLFMTGVLAGKSRVFLFDDNRFDYYCGDNQCLMETMVAMHGCNSVNQTLFIWDHWKQSDQNICNQQNPWTSRFGFNLFNLNFSIDFNL